MEAEFSALLGRLSFDHEVLDWVREALHDSHAVQRDEQQAAIARHQVDCERLHERIHAMYVDKLDGRVDGAFFDRMSAQWRREQDECQRQIDRLRAADQRYLEDGIRILELARNAANLFRQQGPREKRRLLDFVLSNSTWTGGELQPVFRQPFDIIVRTATAARLAETEGRAYSVKNDIWLGD